MCLLSFFPGGVAPDLSALAIGASVNRDGHGWAMLTRTRIITGHGMNADEVLAEFARARDEHPHGPAVFHSRWATRGIITVGNCHPFALGRDERTWLAHNGTLPQRVHPGPYDPRSDTRIAAEDFLPAQPFGSVDTRRGFRGLESWLGRSKLVLLTIDPAYAHRSYMFNEHLGTWESGIWYSNTSYQARQPTLWRGPCRYCRTRGPGPGSRYCGRCGWCFVCLADFAECDCYAQHSRRRSRAFGPSALIQPRLP
ncbi:class II glutamine amidotransferase [Nocardia sp. CA2R105]|uniref:class II glutamine amidotransferase n=1 Tax=Nocardia coffeae TaxID=2873381 RepID=UPI001CA6768F|nr:class II glutamine amidotransferase [Nocardia coffeae]MBY8863548.1 class II glutamine amidotransferase [Nocardia coffeae]